MSSEKIGITELILGYLPNTPLAAIATAIYASIALALSFRVYKSKAWWGLCLPIGAYCETLGFILRTTMRKNNDNLGLFAIEELLIICSPAAFLAFNYITYGHLISHVGPEHSIVDPRKVAKIFVSSDIFTFLLQACGSGLETSSNLTNDGQKIVLAGLSLQALSYVFFTVLLIKSHRSIQSAGGASKYDSSIRLVWVLYFSSTFIIIRCIYRVIEFAQGRHGYLLTHEVFLYCFDALPLLLAIVVYIPFWPANYITSDKREHPATMELNPAFAP